MSDAEPTAFCEEHQQNKRCLACHWGGSELVDAAKRAHRDLGHAITQASPMHAGGMQQTREALKVAIRDAEGPMGDRDFGECVICHRRFVSFSVRDRESDGRGAWRCVNTGRCDERIAAKAEARAAERARIVAWLRADTSPASGAFAWLGDQIADAIERGEHDK